MLLSKLVVNYLFLNITSVLLFSGVYYYLMSQNIYNFHIPSETITQLLKKDSNNKTNYNIKNLEYLDCLYLSLITQSTIGYGDVIPRTRIAKICTMIQGFTVFLITFICFSKLIKDF